MHGGAAGREARAGAGTYAAGAAPHAQRLAAMRIRRLMNELGLARARGGARGEASASDEATPGITLEVAPGHEDDFRELIATISGPEDTVYSGLVMHVSISIPDAFPLRAPYMEFIDVPFHPNIAPSGVICVSFLKDSGPHCWTSGTSLRSALVALQSLLDDPEPDDPLDREAAAMWRRCRDSGDWAPYRRAVLSRMGTPEAEALLEREFGVRARDEHRDLHPAQDDESAADEVLVASESEGDGEAHNVHHPAVTREAAEWFNHDPSTTLVRPLERLLRDAGYLQDDAR